MWLVPLLWGLGASLVPDGERLLGKTNVEEESSYIADISERYYLDVRETRMALAPRVLASISGSINRTSGLSRSRSMNTSFHLRHFDNVSLGVAGFGPNNNGSGGEVVCGARAADYYIYALRHIII